MTELFEAQAALQAEADAVVEALGLVPMLGAIGEPVRVGSSAMGLMVRRDIDITVVCPRLDAATLRAFAGIGAALMQRTDRVVSVNFRNDSGQWNREPELYPDGFYLCVTVGGADGASWTIDIWAVDEPQRQPDLAHLETLLPRLTAEHRAAILAIKQVLAQRPERAPSALVYEAVVDHGVRSVEAFDAWGAGRMTR